MESEQHMSEKTPGQAAYEAWLPLAYDTWDTGAWDERDARDREAWEAAAQAAIDAAMPDDGTGNLAYRAYCAASGGKSLISGQPLPAWEDQADEIRRAWERAAYAVSRHMLLDGQQTRHELGQLREQLAAVVNPTAQDYDNAAEILRLRDQLAGVRERLESLAAGLERQPSRSARVTETKRNIARAVRDIAGQIGRGR